MYMSLALVSLDNGDPVLVAMTMDHESFLWAQVEPKLSQSAFDCIRVIGWRCFGPSWGGVIRCRDAYLWGVRTWITYKVTVYFSLFITRTVTRRPFWLLSHNYLHGFCPERIPLTQRFGVRHPREADYDTLKHFLYICHIYNICICTYTCRSGANSK